MKIITLFALILSCSFLSAQQFNVSLSEKIKLNADSRPLKSGDGYFSLATDTKNQFGYTFKLNKVKYSAKLQKYDKNLKMMKEVKLADGERVFGPFKPFLKIVDDKIFFINYQQSEESDRILISASEIDPVSLSLHPSVELLSIEQKNVGLQQSMDLITSNKFVFSLSPDHSRSLVLWSSGINNQVFLSVMGDGFKKIRSANELVRTETTITVANACLDNAGNVFVACYNEKNKTAHLLINRDRQKTVDRDIKIQGGTPGQVFVLPSNKDNSIKLAGTYKEMNGNLAGAFSETLTAPDFQLNAPVKSAFPKLLVEQFDNDGWANAKTKNFGISDLIDFQPFVLEDGSIDLVGEFRRIEQGTKTSFVLSGDILNVHIKKDGTIFSRIPKLRVSAGSTFGDSFYPIAYKNQVIVFYNDHEANMKQDIGKSPSRSDNYKNSVLVAASINAEGNVKREILIDLSREDYLPVAEDLQQLSPSSILVPIRRIKGFGSITDDFKWGTIEIK